MLFRSPQRQQKTDGLQGMGPEIGPVIRRGAVCQLRRVPQPPPGQPQGAAAVVLHGQHGPPQGVVGLEVQPLPMEAVVVSVARAADLIVEVEVYEENCPAHHFDYFISGAGYPYHHCFRRKRLSLKEYDGLWRDFLGMEHDESAALRLAWRRLRWPADLGETAAADYRAYLKKHAGEALRLLLEEEEGEALPLQQIGRASCRERVLVPV